MELETRKSARLDRAVCCDAWRRVFPSTIVKHLRMLTQTIVRYCYFFDGIKVETKGERPFWFQAALMLRKDYFKWMEKEWAYNGDLVSSLKRFQKKLKAWNKDTFGQILKRKRRV